MATITADTFLDGGTSRTAGEAWTINGGAKLTIRTDTRVHANAPASMMQNVMLAGALLYLSFLWLTGRDSLLMPLFPVCNALHDIIADFLDLLRSFYL